MEIVIKKRSSKQRFADTSYNEMTDKIVSVSKYGSDGVKVVFEEKGDNSYGGTLKEILQQNGLTPKKMKTPSKKSIIFTYGVTKDGKTKAQKALEILLNVKGDQINDHSYLTTSAPYKVCTSNGVKFEVSDAQLLKEVVNADGTTSVVFDYTTSSRNEQAAIEKGREAEAASGRSTAIIVAVIAAAVVGLLVTLLIIKKKK